MKDTRICKICGKEYKACRPVYTNDIYRWQDVACCQEHGLEYFALVEESRRKGREKVAAVDEAAVAAPVETQEATEQPATPKRRKKKSAG